MTPKSLIGFALVRSWSDNLNRSNTWENKKDKQRRTKTTNKPTSHKDDKITK